MHRRSLAISIGWNDEWPTWTHSLAPPLPPCPGNRGEEERGHQQDAAGQQQQVAVTLEIAGVADRQQRDDIEDDPDGHPAGLGLGIGRVPAGDDDVADAVEQSGQGQDHGVGLGHQPAVGHVGDQGEPEQDPEERADVGRDFGLGSQFGNHVEGRGQQRGEDEQAQFGSTLRLGSRHIAGKPGVTRGTGHSPDRSGAK